LGSTLTLRRLVEPLSVSDLAAAGSAGFREWSALEPLAAGATAEIVSPTSAAHSPPFDALRRCWLVSALLVLRGFLHHTCPACSAYPWSRIAGHHGRSSAASRKGAAGGTKTQHAPSRENLPRFQGKLLDCHPRLLVPREMRTAPFDAREAAWFAGNFEKFDRLASDDERVRFALEAAVDWRYEKNPRAAMARLWAGLEPLIETKSELIYRVSQRIAAVIAPRGPERLAAFRKVKDLCELKAKSVRGERAVGKDLLGAVHDSFEVLRALLLDVVERGAVRTEADF
jgi:hypothetical protein